MCSDFSKLILCFGGHLVWCRGKCAYTSQLLWSISVRTRRDSVPSYASMTYSSWVTNITNAKNHGCPTDILHPSRTNVGVRPAFLCPFAPRKYPSLCRLSGISTLFLLSRFCTAAWDIIKFRVATCGAFVTKLSRLNFARAFCFIELQ